jgi:hypothetical protein
MKRGHQSDYAEITPEVFGLNSLVVATSSADHMINMLTWPINANQSQALLQETIFFHHFMAIAAALLVIPDRPSQRDFCDRMVSAIRAGTEVPSCEDCGLAPLTHFSKRNQETAIGYCFNSAGGIIAGMQQDLYLRRKPSKSDLEIMNLNHVKEMTGWHLETANTVQYFAAVLISRLCGALEIEPPSRYFEFLRLSFCATGEAKASFKLYTEALRGNVNK